MTTTRQEDTAVANAKGRRTIQANGRFLRDLVADSIEAIKETNTPPTLFKFGSAFVRVDGNSNKAEPLNSVMLKSELDQRADYVKVAVTQDEEGKVVERHTPARPPAELAPAILSLPSLPVPALTLISCNPVVSPDGRMLTRTGFDEKSGFLTKLNGLEGLRSDMPVADAVRLLDEVFADFPFVDDAGRAHVFAMILQGFVRPIIRGPVPLYLVDAPTCGTGKGLLCEAVITIASGYWAPVMSQPRDGDELEKRITSVLVAGHQTVFLDNVERLNSSHLAAVLTSDMWQGRILGKSETVTVPNRATWLASGNNVELSDELARRIIPVRLDSGLERPEERTIFRHKNLPVWVQEHRGDLVSACLSLIQAWLDKGQPQGESTLGRYESWASVMGGILGVSGVSGFLTGRDRVYVDADNETTEWAILCEAWWRVYGERPVAAHELFEVAREHRLLLDLWGGRSELSAKQRFGHALNARRDRVFGGLKIRNAGKDAASKSNTYRLKQGQDKTPETPLNPASPVREASYTQGFSRGFEFDNLEPPIKPHHNPVDVNVVQNATSETGTGVSGVYWVLNRSPSKAVDDFSRLIGTTEGEL